MQEHGDEEHRVKVGDDSSCANDSSPSETHGPVGNVIGLARVCPPAAREETVTVREKTYQPLR